ncbi:IS66 family insertion sequence element accessory protein TnpA, partial [Plebeiibacterium sediminum]
EQSGLSVRDFCSNQGFAVSTFYKWKKTLQEEEQVQSFVPLVIKEKKYTKEVPIVRDEKTIDDNTFEFTFPNGTKLKLTGVLDLSVLKAIIHL